MGQLPSKEEARLRVLQAELDKVNLLLDTLQASAAAEAAAGIPGDSYLPQYKAAVEHLKRQVDEKVCSTVPAAVQLRASDPCRLPLPPPPAPLRHRRPAPGWLPTHAQADPSPRPAAAAKR